MDTQRPMDDEFAIIELEPRDVPSPDAFFWGWCGSGGGSGGGWPTVSLGSGGWGRWGGSGT